METDLKKRRVYTEQTRLILKSCMHKIESTNLRNFDSENHFFKSGSRSHLSDGSKWKLAFIAFVP
jgi:hypothetical protein